MDGGINSSGQAGWRAGGFMRTFFAWVSSSSIDQERERVSVRACVHGGWAWHSLAGGQAGKARPD